MKTSQKSLLLSPATKKHMRIILVAQAVGTIGNLLFSNGFILAYLDKLHVESSDILLLLTMPTLAGFFMTMPAAYLSDRFGKKNIGVLGLIGTVIGYALLILAGSAPTNLALGIAFFGITIFGCGFAFFSSNWFALLQPIVPPPVWGSFFGMIRVAFQCTAIVFTLIVSFLLDWKATPLMYQALLSLVVAMLLARLVLYFKIPELDTQKNHSDSFMEAVSTVYKLPNFMPFCSYSFLLMLATGCGPWLFGLLEKDVLSFSSSQIVLMGNLLLTGSLVGFYIGGKLIDRYTPKPVFLFSHFSFAIVLCLIPTRLLYPWPPIYTMGVLTFYFGATQAASAIALTTEMMALIPDKNKSLATALHLTLMHAGVSFSGIICAKILDFSILSQSWTYRGLTLSNYDSFFLGQGLMVLTLTVTLGLVPSVVGKAQWVPQGS